MMRKLVVRFLMLMFVLGMSTNAAWAGGSFDLDSLPPQMIQTLMNPTYCAQLTGHASSTGGGKVYVNAPQAGQSVSADPRDTEYVEGTSNVAVSGMGMSMAGMTKIGINAWAKADPGYWFAGFSFSNMGVDLGTTTDENMPGLYANTYDIGIQPNETIEHVIYGTFEPIRIAGYEITGNATTHDDGAGNNKICDLEVIFTPSGATVDIDESDFKDPVVSGEGWSLTSWDYNSTNEGKITVAIHFSTASSAVAEYAGSVKLETKAIPVISMNVPLNARTAASSEAEAIRYNKNKVLKGQGTLDAMIAAADPTDIVKLNKDYDNVVSINKTVTFDLNGYTLNNTLTVAGGDVTIAYSPYGGSANALSVTNGKAIVNGGTFSSLSIGENGAVVQNGAIINGSVTNAGTLTTTDGIVNGLLTSSGALTINGGTFTNNSDVAINVTSGTAQIKKGAITSNTYGVKSAGTTTIEKLAVIRGGTESKALNVIGGKTTVKCGKFADPSVLSNVAGGVFEFQSAYFQEDNMGVEDVEGKKLWRNTSGAEYREGYVLFAGDLAAAQAAGVSVCHIGGISYTKLEDAFAFANNTSEEVVIIMDNDYILPAGYYTLPSTATLLIPKSNEQGASSAYVERYNSQTVPSMFRKLTLENGANLDVFGIIEVGGTQFTGSDSHTGATTGEYGQLQLNEGSRITLQNGSIVRAWGYITGDIEHQNPITHVVPMGEIDARRGATVYEMFQMGDWGNTVMNGVGLVTGDSRFPVNSYFVQNIEAPVKYHPGAKLFAQTSVSAGGMITMCANEIQVIGVSIQDVAVFLMDENADAENTWVRKWYDASNDQQVYEINSGAHIGSLVINLASSPLFDGMENYVGDLLGMPAVTNIIQQSGAHFEQDIVMNSGQYVLPITYNFKLHLLSGTLDFTQNTELIPGAELEIDKGARVYVTKQSDPDVLSGSLYIWDNQDWEQTPKKVDYSPVFGGEPTTRDINNIESAIINVHGTFDTNLGYIFTSARGGNIFSSVEDAGTFMFTEDAKADDYYEEVKVSTSSTAYCYSAFLRNSDEYVAAMRVQKSVSEEEAEATYRYVKTGGTKAGQSYCYIDMGNGGEWTMLEQRGCVTYNAADGKCYIKPQEYVEIAVSDSTWNAEDAEWIVFKGNEDHTFSDAAGAGRLFILLTDELGNSCQWWEVEQKNNYYHCIHPENDTYYWWNPNLWEEKDENDDPTGNHIGGWDEVRFTITWKDKKWGVENTPDTILQTYQVPYGTQAEWLSTNPTRPATVDYTYDFTGWSPALDKVTSDVTYTATYEEKQIKYTITFVQDGGMEIERHLLARNEMPVCENVPTRTGYILEWSPALAAVTGNQTYTATWLPVPPEEYAITFYDYNGTTKLKPTSEDPYMVAVGTVPTPPANPSGKPATSEYTYVFDHWSPALEEVSTTSAKVYTAVYREVAREYTIYYFKEDGVTPNATKASESLPYGATPTPPTVSKEDPENGHTYTLVWKNLEETATIQTVTGNASYKPTYIDAINKYTVSVRSNPSGACTISGAGVYDYNTSATITLSVNSGYTFNGWSAGQGDLDTTITVTSDVNLVANFTYNGEGTKYTITWKNKAGNANLVDPVTQLENTATIYTGPTPTEVGDAQYSYVFDGWVTDTDYPEEGVFYKNNMTPKATKNATYYAHFAATPRKYTITWKNEAGTADIEVDYDQPYGTATAFNSATPTKQATAAATYTFDGWATEANGVKVYEIGATPTVGVDATYYAHFQEVPRTYTITWLDENGGLIDQTIVEYGVKPAHAIPTKASTAEYTYAFNGWDNTPVEVAGEATYKATFSQAKRKYTITWLNDDNSEIGQTEVEYGVVPMHADATKDNTAEYTYTFTGWDTDPVAVTGEATYKATFSAMKNSYEITWLNDDNSLIDKTIVEYGVVPTHADATKDNTAEYTYTFTGWDNTPVAVTGAATYKATFSSTVNTYTITWKNWDGTTLETDENVPYGTMPSYNGEEPTKAEDEQNTYTFQDWSPEVAEVTGDAVYTAQFNAIPKINNMEIGINETETLNEATTRDNLVITSNGINLSGELVGADNLTLSGDAYFDLVLNAQSHVWYAVAVPWQVDAETGISVNGNTLTLGVDFDLLYYNGELRASQGVNQAWNYVENDANKTMQPGRLYMIGLMLDAPVIRFAKKSTAAILTTSTSVTEYASAVVSDANWNGIANPALFHAYLNAGTEEGQIYDANAVGYNLITLNTHKLVVGQPVFVQAPHTKSVVVTYGGPFAAPSHAQTQENAKYEVQIASEEGASTDRLFIKIDEDKSEDTYVIGKDLAKMGVSSKVAQLWVNRYNAKLCVNTQAPVNGVAEYPLGIYVPVSGNYTISCQTAALSEHDALYLTYDGQVVANLTQSAYTIMLNAGTDVHYALRVGTTSDDATGMDEIIVDAQGQTRKVLVNDHVFIIRGDKVYTIDGQLVK